MENPHAFPHFGVDESGTQFVDTKMKGMTLRDYFAAKAIQATLSNPNSTDSDGYWKMEPHIMARDAYGIADAMLQSRLNTQNRKQ